jgi:hypothetical protein
MPKYWIVKNLELIKKVYVVDAYNKPSAEYAEALHKLAPHSVEVLKEVGYEIESINEYEYNEDWTPQEQYSYRKRWQKDWVGFKGLDPDIGPDQLKDQPL